MPVDISQGKTEASLEILRLVGGLVGQETLQTRITSILSNLTTVDTVVDGIQTDLDSGVDGLGALKALLDIIDGYHDVPSADSGDDVTVRDVVGKKADTSAGSSAIALLKKVQETLDGGQTGGISFEAEKSTSAVAQGASEVLDLGEVEGFDCINAVINDLVIDVTGSTSNYKLEIFRTTGSVNLRWAMEFNEGENVVLDGLAINFRNKDAVLSKHCYLKITNNADIGTSTFAISIAGEKRSDTLA